MKVTWKKWTCFLVAVIAIGTACHLTASKYLVNFERLWLPMEFRYQMRNFDVRKILTQQEQETSWDEAVVMGSLDYMYGPWPLFGFVPEQEPRRVDPDNPQTQDPETIMGLALLGPEMSGLMWYTKAYPEESDRLEKEMQVWFARLSRLAMTYAENPKMKQDFSRLLLYRHNTYLRDPKYVSRLANELGLQSPGSSEESLQKKLQEHMWARSREIDPNNDTYSYDKALQELEDITEQRDYTAGEDENPILPSEYLSQDFMLKENAKLLPTAGNVDELLTHAERNCSPNRFQAYRIQLLEKAWSFLYPDTPDGVEDIGPTEVALSHIASLSFAQRKLAMHLCFIGDSLVDGGEDALALRMYQHAYEIGQRLMLATGEEATLVDNMIGNACLSLTNSHLMEYWAKRADPRKVSEISYFNHRLRFTSNEISKSFNRTRLDPFSNNDAAFVVYLRSAGLTWWFSSAGMVMVILSLLCAGGYLLFRQGRNLGPDTPPLWLKGFAVLIGVMIAMMIWLGLLMPLELQPLDKLGTVIAWAYILVVVWTITVGLFSSHVVSQTMQVRRSATGWVWPVMGVAAIAVATGATIGAERPTLTGAAFAIFGMVACVLVWAAVAVMSIITRRTPADRAYRACVSKTFAVGSMLAAIVLLLAALATMPLTHHHQNKYYELVRAEQRDEVRAILGDDWPKSFSGLSPDLFSVDGHPNVKP